MTHANSDSKAPIEECFQELSTRLFELDTSKVYHPILDAQELLDKVKKSIFAYRPDEGISRIDNALLLIEQIRSDGPPKKKPNSKYEPLFGDKSQFVPTVKTDKQDWLKELE